MRCKTRGGEGKHNPKICMGGSRKSGATPERREGLGGGWGPTYITIVKLGSGPEESLGEGEGAKSPISSRVTGESNVHSGRKKVFK